MLSAIAKGYFSSSSVLVYPIVALLLFLAAFTIISIRVLSQSRESIDATAALPLADDFTPVKRQNSSETPS